VALGDCCSYGFLVTLGGCLHLDNLGKLRSIEHRLKFVRGLLMVDDL
jgi:hypothetical protein